MRHVAVGRRQFTLTAAAAVAGLATGCARQEGPWPAREVRVVVHAAPGGMSDTVARFTARGLNARLGVPVLCENRVGAMGAVAFSAVKHAATDGYVVGYAPVELSIVPHLRYVDLAIDDFDLLARHHRAPAALAVPIASPYTTLDAFVTAFRGGARIKLGTAGPLSVWHLGALALSRHVDRTFIYAPFPGSGPATTALLGGHVDAVMAGVPEVQALVRAGAVRLLGLMADRRSPVFPEVPTFQALGLDLVFEAWGGFMVPRGVDAQRRARLERDILEAFKEPAFLAYCRTAGLDAITGYPRFTFGQPELLDGVSFIPVMVGLFGIAEVLSQMAGPARQQLDASTQTSGMLPTMEEARPLWSHGLRGSLMGIWIGIMPAAGADVGAILAWDQSRRFSKRPELFGKGSLEGLIAATTGANAGIGGSLVTTLALGIPGDSAAAVLIGALLMHGLQPGPLLFRNRPDLVATIVALVFMAAIVTFVWGLIGARLLAKILRIRDQFLWATVLAVSLGGSYALNQSTADVWTAVGAGILGFAMRRQGFPMGPLVLGLILGPMAESNLRRALALSEGSLATFFVQPISLLFLVLAALTLLWPLISKRGADSRLPDSNVPDGDTL